MSDDDLSLLVTTLRAQLEEVAALLELVKAEIDGVEQILIGDIDVEIG